ncbi:MAG: PEP-CTERM sorting domain-containing protein [Rhodanobacter sp.]
MRHFSNMPLKRLVSASLALFIAILLTSGVADATPYVVRLVQQGNNVVAAGSGAFDLTGLTAQGGYGSVQGAGWPVMGYVYTGLALTTLDGYTGFSGPASFGSGSVITGAASVTGDAVGIYASSDFYGFPLIFVPSGYVSDSPLRSGGTWDNASLASLGVTPGTYTWSWGNGADQSFTLTTMTGTIPTGVPEPAALALFGLGVMLVGGFVTLRRRERRPTA